jgi:phosphoglycolate phosphatase
MLRALVRRGVRLALVSSDHEGNARRLLGDANAALFGDFACGASLFGKAAKFSRVLKRAGVAPERALCIGDEIRDLEAARAAGIAFGAVAWGYASATALQARAPDVMFRSMEDIVDVLA